MGRAAIREIGGNRRGGMSLLACRRGMKGVVTAGKGLG